MPKEPRIGAIPPGAVIAADFLIPLGKTGAWLAAGLELPETPGAALLTGQRALTTRTALRPGAPGERAAAAEGAGNPEPTTPDSSG